jgi:hypothetical protein
MEGMSTQVLPDRVSIGPEFVPRRLELAQVKQVAVGETWEPPTDSIWDYIEVAGSLRFSRTHDTILRTVHLIILPGGALDCGTVADPITSVKVEIIWRDVPFDFTKDPYQWGNGLVNFGTRSMVGATKDPWLEATGSLEAGATTVALERPPVNWEIGDELLIPDGRTPRPIIGVNETLPRREAPAFITAVSGAQVTLSKPLDFEHHNIVNEQGVVRVRPRVFNLTRKHIYLHSEREAGTRGHMVDVGSAARWTDHYTQTFGMGRTRADVLDVTTHDAAGNITHIGTNQIAKYNAHHHHCDSNPDSSDVGCVWKGSASLAIGAKWGLSMHSTSDALVEGVIAVDFPGACFATEDGNEVRDTFRKCAALYSLLFPFGPQGQRFEAKDNVERNAPGCEGSGFWFRGTMNTFDGLEAWNCFTNGINLFNQQQPPGILFPSMPGMMPDTLLQNPGMVPILCTDNVCVGNVIRGFEGWNTPDFPNVRLIAANNFNQQYDSVISDHIDTHLVDCKILGEVGIGDISSGSGLGIQSSFGYVGHCVIEGTAGDGAEIVGCSAGIAPGGSINGIVLRGNVKLQCQTNIPIMPRIYDQGDGVMHLKLRDYPERFLVLGVDASGALIHWDGIGPLPTIGISLYIPARTGSLWTAKNWQGSGEDRTFLANEQLGTNPSWYSEDGPHSYNTPVKGLTMQQSWDRYGLSVYGDVLDPALALETVGIINGKGRKGLGTKFSQPRAVCTFPTMDNPAIVRDGLLQLSVLLTGDPNTALATDDLWYSIDGSVPAAFGGSTLGSDDRSFRVEGARVATGTHTIEVWRVLAGVEVPGSRTKSGWFVGVAPPPPPPPTTVTVPNLVGMLEAAADAAILAAQLVVGAHTSINDPAPKGTVLTQSPSAGTVVPIGSSVNYAASLGPVAPAWEVICVLRDAAGNITREIKQLKTPGQPNRYALHDPVKLECAELLVGPDPGCD